MSIKMSRLNEIINEEIQLFLERTQQLNEQGFTGGERSKKTAELKMYKAQLATAESELDKMLQKAPGRVSAKAKRVQRKKISDLKALIASARVARKSNPYRKALKRAQNARNRVTKDDYVKGGKVADRIHAIKASGKSKAEKTKALNALANKYPKKPAGGKTEPYGVTEPPGPGGKSCMPGYKYDAAVGDCVRIKKKKKIRRRGKRKGGYRPKRGSARHVLKKGVFPKSQYPGYDSFDDFYAAVAKNPKAAKLLSRNGRLRKGGRDRRWGPSHRDAYSVLMGRQTGKAKVDSKEQAQIGKERKHSRHFGSSDRAVSDKQYYISQQEKMTTSIEKTKKAIRALEADKAAGKLSSKKVKDLEALKKMNADHEKRRNVAVQKAKDAAAGKDVGGPVSTRKKAAAEQAALAKQAAKAKEDSEVAQSTKSPEEARKMIARRKKDRANRDAAVAKMKKLVKRNLTTSELANIGGWSNKDLQDFLKKG